MDCGATPRLSCSTTASHTSSLDPARKVANSSAGGFQASLALLPVRADSRDPCLVASPGTIRLRITLGGIFAFVIQQRISQRTQNRLGMLPANVLQRAPTVGHVDGLVANITEITSPIAAKNFKQIVLLRGADQASHGGIGRRFVPVVHGFSECLPRFRSRWHG